ncbi:nucleotide sugar dehydratase [Floricoccus tropicus]|uniref:Nucleotide sugar dehydratase n=1 Tax=Floricoccus tropicus TaxID=1859473 RepID=A0A1E8GKI4_9LACT|nr:NAD-dependent epimerase/dehydratase family protein [Floricoccus tropicus]OFI48760.1 nucleotide sugar dehydratase [Floricoccus tropicus]
MIDYKDEVIQNDLKLITSQNYISWDKLKGKTVLVTGASGMLATYMIYTLAYLNDNFAYNIKIIGTVRNIEKASLKFSSLISNEYFDLIRHDVTKEFTYDGKIDYIVHAASNASPKFIINDPVGIINANTIGTLNLLNFAKDHPIENLLFLSTREVYGKAISDYIDENSYGGFDILESRACYPESKRMAETLLKSFNDQFGVPFTITRIAHSYGPGMQLKDDGRIMSDLLLNVVNSEDIILKSDGTAERAFCYIADAVSALFLVLLDGENANAYNVANEDEPIQIRELAKKLTEIFAERNISVVFDIPKQMGLGYSKMGRTRLNTEKIELLGWRKKVSLEQGLVNTIKAIEE